MAAKQPLRRQASHAGSWYSSSAEKLSRQLQGWLAEARTHFQKLKVDLEAPVDAVISPHAGFAYSGPTAAFCFSRLQPKRINRIFLLGPSHKLYSNKALLTQCQEYRTPVGDIPVDTDTLKELEDSGLFGRMSLAADEAEHSLEMQLPFIAEIMRGQDYKLVPIMVGSISEELAAKYGRLFASYLNTPGTVFVISSDFCHWGSRFDYTPYDKSKGEIWQSIEALDRLGMKLIEEQDPKAFAEYLRRFGNTICGRHPIGVLLNTLQAAHKLDQEAPERTLEFTRYAQSERCKTPRDSSVSYAAAVVVQQQQPQQQ